MSEQEFRRSTSIDIEASPDVVYDTVRQLERMGEWSPENRGGRWIEGDGSKVGDRFEGDNRRGEMKWTFPVTVTAAERGVVFAFGAGQPEHPLTRWTYRMIPNATGTTVTETWELLAPEVYVESLGEDYPTQRAALIEGDLVTTLTNLKASIESAD
jgi:hypothetical protein